MSDRTDTVLEAIYDALAKWDEAERQARDLRSISKADVRRVDRFPDGTRIPAPRRGAVARYLTDAVLTALSDLEAAPRSPETPEAAPGLDDRWIAAITAHMADFYEQPESFGSVMEVAESLARHHARLASREEGERP